MVPLLAARPEIPATHGGPPGYRPEEWDLSTSFAEANRERYVDLICLARMPGVCWSLLGGWLVYRWRATCTAMPAAFSANGVVL